MSASTSLPLKVGDFCYIETDSSGCRSNCVGIVLILQALIGDIAEVIPSSKIFGLTSVYLKDLMRLPSDSLESVEGAKKNKAEALKAQYVDICEILDSIFKDNYETKTQGSELDIIIHFPEVITENSLKKKHKHKDIFLSVHLDKDLKYKKTCGMRSTYSYLEMEKGHVHPHIYPGFSTEKKSVCFGAGPIIDCSNELHLEYNPDRFEAFLYSLIDWIHWESFEGGPYQQGTKALVRTNRSAEDCSTEIKKKALKAFLEKVEYFPLEFKGGSDVSTYVVSQGDKFEKLCTSVVPDSQKSIKFQGSYYQNTQLGDLKAIIKQKNDRFIAENKCIVFKDKKYYLTIEEGEVPEVDPKSLVCNPYITKFIRAELERMFNESEYNKPQMV